MKRLLKILGGFVAGVVLLVGDAVAWAFAKWDRTFEAPLPPIGPLLPHTPMPWTAFQRMSDADVRSLFRYLHSLPPQEVDPGPSMRRRES